MTLDTAISAGLLLLSIAYIVVFVFLVFVLEPPRAGRWILPVMAIGSGLTAGGVSASIATGVDFFLAEDIWRLCFITVQLVSLWAFNIAISAWVITEFNATRKQRGQRRNGTDRRRRKDDWP